MKRALLCISVFLTLSLCAVPALDFEGTLFADYYGSIEPATGYESLRGRGYYQPRLYGSLFDYAMDYTISANLYYDAFGSPDYVAPENIIREAYIYIPLTEFDISIGQMFLTGGMNDISSPFNIINGDHIYKLSLDDPFEGKRADALVQVVYYPTYEDSIELVYVPFPRPDYEPLEPRTISGSDVDVTVDLSTDPYLLQNGHSLFLNYSHYGFEYDLQLHYGWYVDQTPSFDLSGLTDTGGTVTGTVTADYRRNHTLGISYGTSIQGITVAGEAAFNLTEDLAGTEIGIRNSDVTINAQVTGTLWGGTIAQLNVIYQYILNFNNYPETFSATADAILAGEFNTYFTQPMAHVAYAIAHLQNSFLHDKLAVSLNLGYLHPNVYIAPRIGYTIADGFTVSAGADILTGNPSDMVLARGSLKDNFYVRVMYRY